MAESSHCCGSGETELLRFRLDIFIIFYFPNELSYTSQIHSGTRPAVIALVDTPLNERTNHVSLFLCLNTIMMLCVHQMQFFLFVYFNLTNDNVIVY